MKRIKNNAKRKQKLRNIIMSFIFALLAITGSVYGINNYLQVRAEGVPSHTKKVLNNGDGTYTIALDVTGKAVKNYKKVNVEVIFDTSGSMDYNTNHAEYIVTNTNNGTTTYYGKVNGEYVRITRSGSGSSATFTVTSTGAPYTGLRYVYSNNPNRLDAARTAVLELADTLLANNVNEGVSDLIEMSLITFARTANTATTTKVNNISAFQSAIFNNISADGGTNWEAGLKEAQNFNFGDTDTTYVIFVSDGNPTFYLNNNGSVGGTGYEQTNNINTSFNQARPEAKNIVDAKKAAPNQTENKYEFYTIGIYGNVNRMQNLTNYAYTGSNSGTIPASLGKRYFAADDTAQLQAALNAILQDIQLKGFGEISIEDGTTESIHVSSGDDSNGGVIEVEEGTYKYYLSIPITNNSNGTITSRATRIRTITKNSDGTYTLVNDKNETYNNVERVPAYVYDEEGNLTLDANGNPVVDDSIFRIEWTKNGTTNVANPFYNAEVTRPDASLNSTSKAVEWNLESLGVLFDNVTYTVTFEAYPSQATLDLIADLMNGTVKYQDTTYAAANPGVWDYISCSTDADGNVLACGIKTNTTATLKYKDTRDESPSSETSYYNEVSPVPTSAAQLLTVSKTWENGLNDGQSSRPIDLIINRDGKERYTVSLPHENKWENTVAASVGIMTIHDGVVTLKTPGHEFSFSEPTNVSYYWDLDAKTVRPMWINGEKDSDGNPVVTMLELQEGSATCTMPSGTDDATCTSGSDTFYRLDGKIYKVNNQLTTLNTTNYRRSNLNVKKVVDGADAPADALFEYEITINDSTIEGPSSENKVWFAIYDENNERVLYSAGSTYVSGANATPEILSLKAKEGSLRNIHDNGDGTYSYEYYEYNNKTGEFEWTPYTITQVGVDADGNPTYYSGSYKADDTSKITIKLKKDWYVKFFNLPKDTTYNVNEKSMPDNFNFVSAKLDGTETTRQTSGTIASNNSYELVYTNKYTLKDVTVNKIWTDNDNQDGLRAPVTIDLMDGNNKVDSVTLEPNDEGVWTEETLTHTFTGLTRFRADGTTEIEYTVVESSYPDDYEPQTPVKEENADGKTIYTIENIHEPAKIDINVEKVWDDNNDQDGTRPDSVTINLMNGNTQVGTVTFSKENGEYKTLTHTFEGLPVYNDATEITYTVVEVTNDTIKGKTEDVAETNREAGKYYYSVSGSKEEGFTVTNTLKAATIDVKVTKEWDDTNDQDGIRPNEVTINLLANGEKVDEVTLTVDATGAWTTDSLTHTFTGIAKNSAGTEITYSVEEVTSETCVINGNATTGYKPTITAKSKYEFNVKNTHNNEKTNISGKKIWVDEGHEDLRPTVTINLVGTAKNKTVVTKSANPTAPKWEYSFDNLDVYYQGEKIVYTVSEVELPEYTTTRDGNDFTNTLKTIDITVEKIWDDNGNQDGTRPDSVTINLMNGTTKVDSVTFSVDAEGNWPSTLTHTFENLPQKSGNNDINYTVEEVTTDPVLGTTAVPVAERTAGKYYYSVSGSKENGFEVTNTLKPETIDLTINKIWDDNNNQDGLRPDSITINLMAGNEVIDSVTFSKNSETGKWPADSELTKTFTGLPKKSHGVDIVYTFVEEEIENYDAIPSQSTNGLVHTIVNKNDPEAVNISVVKTWDDNNNQDGLREASVTINLLADNKKVDEVTLNSQYGWSHTFKDKPKYRDGGTPIAYTVEEEKTDIITNTGEQGTYNINIEKLDNEGYSYKVTNTLVPILTSVSGTKTWSDNNDQDGIRPDSIEIKLYADGQYVTSQTVETNNTNDWTYTFSNIPKYHDGGIAIKYTVGEDDVTGYTSSCDANTHICTTMNITNTHKPETVDVVGKKTWVDSNDIEGFRPDNITVHLIQDKTDIKTINVDATNVDEEGSWLFEIKGLPKYHDGGQEYTYTITEDPVKNYDDPVYENDEEGNPYIIVNTHSPKELAITVEKVWDDVSAEGIENLYGHPEKVEVKLTGTVEIDDEVVYEEEYTAEIEVDKETGDWKHTFTELPEYREGMLVSYTATEITDVENYEPHVTTDDNKPNTYIITNKYSPEYRTNITGTKTWKDENDNDGIRPDSIELVLTDNYENEVSRITVEPDEEGNWNYEFTDLPKYANGEEIIYTLSEVTVDGYEVIQDGYNLTNTHETAKVSFDIVKIWADNNDNDGLRPDSITVKAVNAKTDEVIATAEVRPDENGKWHYEFKDLNKYKDGELIEYKIIEEAVAGYTNTIVKKTTEETTTYEITNTHEDEMANIRITKEWDDTNDAAMLRPSEITVDVFVEDEKVKTVIITETDGWEITITDLPKYKNGEEIEYRIEEHEITEYETTITKTDYGFHILNHHELGKGNGEDPEELPPQTSYIHNTSSNIIYIILTILSIIGISFEFIKEN